MPVNTSAIRPVLTHANLASKTVRPWWKRPGVWVSTWLFYSLAALGYLAYESAQRGFICVSIF